MTAFCARHRLRARARLGGFTLTELAVSTLVASAVVGALFAASDFCLTTYSKTLAINLAHQEARVGTLRMLSALHSTPAIPQLIDSSRQPVNGEGPAPGISFQEYLGGPFKIAADAAQGANMIAVTTDGYVPPAGSILVVPSHRIETGIVSTSGSGSVLTLVLAQSLPCAVITSNSYGGSDPIPGTPATTVVLAHFTRRSCFLVVGEEMRYHPWTDRTGYETVVRGVATPLPFTTPANASGAPHARTVGAVNLSTASGEFSNRNYAAVNLLLNSWIPQRSRLGIQR